MSMNSTLDFQPPWDTRSPNGHVTTEVGPGLYGPDIPLLLFEADNTTRAVDHMAGI
jgi:hypothetical protein